MSQPKRDDHKARVAATNIDVGLAMVSSAIHELEFAAPTIEAFDLMADRLRTFTIRRITKDAAIYSGISEDK